MNKASTIQLRSTELFNHNTLPTTHRATMEDTKDIKDLTVAEPRSPVIGAVVPSTELGIIYIDPEKEKAALRKFDKWLVPLAFIFLVLSSLDRNNVGLR